MTNLIGVDGRALAVVGLALPYGEWISDSNLPERVQSGALDSQFARGVWCPGDPQLSNGVTWEHDDTFRIAEPQNVSILNAPSGLYFHALLPDNARGRHAAQCAGSGIFGASVGNFDIRNQDQDGTVTACRIRAIGLTDRPAYETVIWRSDAAPESMPTEARDTMRRFQIADMAARSRTDAPEAKGTGKAVIHIFQDGAKNGKPTYRREVRTVRP
ncbi:MAG: hypothetical protein RIA64_01795 [Rhodospirillales bacterium]